MQKFWLQILLLGSAILTWHCLSYQSFAAPVNQSTKVTNRVEVTSAQISIADTNYLSQLTSVSQLSDVQPTDWVQALQSLVERYGCIAGYGSRTF